MTGFFQNILLAICLLLGPFGWANWEGIGPEGTKAIQLLLKKADSEGYSIEFLERKIQEGLAKGKSTEDIIKALESRYLVLKEISKEKGSGQKDMAAALLKKELANKPRAKKTASPVLKPKSKQNSEGTPRIKVKSELKGKEKGANRSSKQGDKNKGKDKLEKGPAKKAQSSKLVEQPGKNGSAKAPNPKIQKDFETKLMRKSEKHQGKMEKKMKGLEKKLEAKEKALEKKQKKISDM